MFSNDEKRKICNFLLTIHLFKGADADKISSALERGDFIKRSYQASEPVYSSLSEEKKLIIFLKGEAEVYSNDENRSVLLRTLSSGGVIGVANLFSSESYVSRVIATKKCETLEISAEGYGKMLENDRAAMYNYISFLSNRICYLNKKIVCLTAGSSERRLAYYLDTALAEQAERGEEPSAITIQMNSLCEMLNLGRASLYRAADKLSEEGFIRREGKKILVLDRAGMMERYR